MEILKKAIGGGKKATHDVQILQIPIPTSIVMKYLPEMLKDLEMISDE